MATDDSLVPCAACGRPTNPAFATCRHCRRPWQSDQLPLSSAPVESPADALARALRRAQIADTMRSWGAGHLGAAALLGCRLIGDPGRPVVVAIFAGFAALVAVTGVAQMLLASPAGHLVQAACHALMGSAVLALWAYFAMAGHQVSLVAAIGVGLLALALVAGYQWRKQTRLLAGDRDPSIEQQARTIFGGWKRRPRDPDTIRFTTDSKINQEYCWATRTDGLISLWLRRREIIVVPPSALAVEVTQAAEGRRPSRALLRVDGREVPVLVDGAALAWLATPPAAGPRALDWQN